MSATAAHALKEYTRLYAVEYGTELLDFQTVFPVSQPVIVEIGFGMGHVTVELARKFPKKNYIGIEVFRPGVGRVLNEVHTEGLQNLRVIRADAVQVIRCMIPMESVHGFHIFFPDPWPKKKHHKRRLIQKDFLHSLAERLEPEGYFYAVTDWQDYADHILQTVENERMLCNPYNGFAPVRQWRPKTSFQRKGEQKDHIIREIWAEKAAPNDKGFSQRIE